MDPELAIKLQFLGPEIVIMVLGPETDNMLQFMDPESVNKGERSYIIKSQISNHLKSQIWSPKISQIQISNL